MQGQTTNPTPKPTVKPPKTRSNNKNHDQNTKTIRVNSDLWFCYFGRCVVGVVCAVCRCVVACGSGCMWLCAWSWLWRVWCGALKPAPPPCPSKTPQCVQTRRLRVYQQQVHMFYTCERVAGTHGDVLNVHTEAFWMDTHGGGGEGGEGGGSTPVLLTKKSPRRVITWLERFTERNERILPIYRFENRSRTSRSRFLKSFALK